MNILDAVEKNDINELKKLLAQGEDINVIDNYGYSALHIASSKLYHEIAMLLIHQNINVNIQDKEGQTILHYAAVYNQLNIAEAALAKGADLLRKDIYGNQPLWTAVFNDKGANERIDIIRLFLQHGADPDHKNNVNKSPLDIIKIAGYNNLKPLFPS
jgi:ankyrin repeat protein